jgi:hypothetical protein
MGFEFKTPWVKLPDETDTDVATLPEEVVNLGRDLVESITTGLAPIRTERSQLLDSDGMSLKFRRKKDDGTKEKAAVVIPDAMIDGADQEIADLVNSLFAYLVSKTGPGWESLVFDTTWSGIGLV